MILHAQAKEGQTGFPWLVFLHGFSGDCREWQTVGEAFQDYSRLYIDLPGHGGSADISVSGFDDVNVLLRNTLLSYNIHNYWLVGYSLGGRVAMMAACQEMPGLCGLVVEGGHPGLQGEEARVQRRLSDGRWAARFRAESLREVFNDWYQQPVFSSLNTVQRERRWSLCVARIMGKRWRQCWRPPRLPYNLIYVRNSRRAHFRFIIYVVNVTINSALWRRKYQYQTM